jgi:60 kDa SS-A/Ro ribonucleoprotein
MQRYTRHVSNRVTPQTQPMFGRPQVENSAGGYVFALDPFAMLDRFLILGAEGGTYCVSESKLTQDNARNVLECIKTDGERVVARTVEVSDSGRAPKNDPALFVLALVCAFGTPAAKQAAYAALPKVARIGTHLFHFAEYVNALRGWGRGLRRAVGNWYTGRSAMALAGQLTKYQSRDGWSHRDLLRLAHPTPQTAAQQFLFGYATRKDADYSILREMDAQNEVAAYIQAVERLKHVDTVPEAVQLITDYRLPREVVPTALLTAPDVWAALLPHMGLTAMLRNLATMTRLGLVAPLTEATTFIRATLTDGDKLRASRVHPLAVLGALLTYQRGEGVRGQHTWTPVTAITDALNDAFYAAFQNVVPTNRRLVLALDVSGSMSAGFIGSMPGLDCRTASAALALVTARTEPNYTVVGFTAGSTGSRLRGGNSGITPLDISPSMRLDDVVRRISGLPFGGTDCALPMTWAQANHVDADGFVVYTDNETWAGTIHPTQALRNYRTRVAGAKLVVNGMVATSFSIADPSDAGMLDVVGFDAAAPAVMADFLRGDL